MNSLKKWFKRVLIIGLILIGVLFGTVVSSIPSISYLFFHTIAVERFSDVEIKTPYKLKFPIETGREAVELAMKKLSLLTKEPKRDIIDKIEWKASAIFKDERLRVEEKQASHKSTYARKTMSKTQMKNSVELAKQMEDHWHVEFILLNYWPSYTCSLSFNKEGGLVQFSGKQGCGYNK